SPGACRSTFRCRIHSGSAARTAPSSSVASRVDPLFMAAREARRRLEVSPRVLRRLISARPDYFPVLLDSAARAASGARAARTLLAAAPGAFLGLTRDNRLVTGG